MADLSHGCGLPAADQPAGPRLGRDTVLGDDLTGDDGRDVALGGLIEAGVNACTHHLQQRLDQLNIPATYDYTPTGTHSWGYWQDAFEKSWPVLASGLGI